MATSLLTQIKNRYYGVDCGMSYVLRVSDGRFVIIDGGYNEEGEAAHLYDVLCAQNTSDTVPTIAAWFFTHPHQDHFGCFVDVCNQFKGKLHIQSVVYNFPTADTCAVATTEPAFENAVQSLENVQRITPVRGQRFCFGDAVFEILMTHLDMPHPIPNLNDSSTVFRTDVAGHRILWLGDAQSLESDRLCELYTARELKCDILQVGHHGYGGGSDALYRAADPKTLLWPIPDFTYHWVKDWDCNRFLMQSDNIRHCYISGREETVLDLSAPFPTPITPTAPLSGETVVEEHFVHTDVYRLGWCCITGGSVSYRPAAMVLEQGRCRLTADDAFAVCEFLQPHKLFKARGYDLSVRCTLDGNDANCGLFWNDETPMKRDLDRVWWLSLPTSRAVNVRLTADGEQHSATVYVDGQPMETRPYTPTEQHGLYFVLQNAVVTIESIRVKAQ